MVWTNSLVSMGWTLGAIKWREVLKVDSSAGVHVLTIYYNRKVFELPTCLASECARVH